MSNRLIVSTANLQADVGKSLIKAGRALEAAGKKYTRISYKKKFYAATHTPKGRKLRRKKSKKARRTKKH